MTARAPKPAVRVLVLDSSARGTDVLRSALARDPALAVVATTTELARAMEKLPALEPDIMVIGHQPASTDALVAVRHIMHTRPLPIVVVSPLASPVQGTLAFDLLEAGALAVVREPWSHGHEDAAALADLYEKVRLMAEVKVVRRWSRPAPLAVPASVPQAPRGRPRPVKMVAIGASTGGPVALKTILSRLPRTFPLPIVVVQHMSPGFTEGLAQWLDADCHLVVRVAAPGDCLRRGHAYLAPDGMHVGVGPNGRLVFDRGEPVNGHMPSVTVLFRSVAQECGPDAIGILLTGMGKDGAAELKLMKDAGAVTIAQDRASSVVHGMPGEAIRCHAASHVMSPDQIAAALPSLAAR